MQDGLAQLVSKGAPLRNVFYLTDLKRASLHTRANEKGKGSLMKRRWVVTFVLAAALSIAALGQMDRINPEEMANRIWEMIHNQDYAFTWHYETEPPPGFYEGSEPHGLILRTFMNNIAYDAVENKLGRFPAHSVIVKENHVTGHPSPGDENEASGPDQDNAQSLEDFQGNLEAITLMVKMPGFNPEAGDWFWAKYQADGSIDAAGTPEGCIACHSQVADNDYVFDAHVTEQAEQ